MKFHYHPSEEIRGTESKALDGKKIVLGVTGSVAIYKAVDLARELIKRSAEVYVVMSKDATKLVDPQLFEWATGNKVFTEFSGEVGHVVLSRTCDGMVIAPATANTIAKLAVGVADTSVSLTALNFIGLRKPLVIVPAMHLAMYKAPQISEAVSKLRNYRVMIFEPQEDGVRAKFPEVDDIAHAVEVAILRGTDLKGMKVLVTAGPTREFLDPVRFLTNASSGRMGIAIAKEAYFRGADVTLIHGPVNTALIPKYVRSLNVTTTAEMLNAVVNELRNKQYDAVILAGAPSDFKFRDVSKVKIDSNVESLEVTLQPTPKIAEEIRKVYNGLVVGFAAETVGGDVGKLRDRAKRKLVERGFNIIVANDVSSSEVGFNSRFNEVLILGSDGFEKFIPRTRKELVAREILDIIKKLLRVNTA